MIALTGKRRYRATAEGLVVLQVEFDIRLGAHRLSLPGATPEWRDATVEDLTIHQRPEA